MNGTVIDISGIDVSIGTINLEDSSDVVNILTIKDEYGKEVTITIIFGKITDVCKK